jgi:hypothetical protein
MPSVKEASRKRRRRLEAGKSAYLARFGEDAPVSAGLSHMTLYGRVCVERSRRGGPNSTTGAENRAFDRG